MNQHLTLSPAAADAPLDAGDQSRPDPDVSLLIRTLRDADQRLAEATATDVDSVTDREGRSFVLQRAQARWLKAGFSAQAAILDAIPVQVVSLDCDGTIVSVNSSWRQAADNAGPCHSDYWIGSNYLAICDAAVGEEAADARAVAAGIRAVLAGTATEFSFEYPCDTPTEKRWFILTTTPVAGEALAGAVVMHMDVSARKRSEDEVARFATAMDASPDGIFLVDREDMCFVYSNDAGCRLLGLSLPQVLALDPWQVLDRSRTHLERGCDSLIVNSEFSDPEEVLWQRPAASPLWIELRRHARSIGGRWTITVVARDVTLRKEADRRIKYLNRVHAVLSGINALIVRVRHQDELFREACRIAVEQGALAMAWLAMVDPVSNKVVPVASCGMFEELLEAISRRMDSNSVASPGNSLPTRVVSERKAFVSNDSQHDPRLNFSDMHVKHGIRSMAMLPLIVADEAVGILVLYAREGGFFHEEQLRVLTELAGDVAFAIAQIEKQARLDYLAYYDGLTGLANRTLFLERVAQYARLASDAGHKLALCLLDVERFRNINDSLGRTAGDSLLRQVATWLTARAGDASILARIDGDHFAMVLPSVSDEEEVARILEDTLSTFSSHTFRLNDTDYRLAAKAGVAILPDDGADAETLYKHAEAALKKAKAGGDKYLFYAQKMTETVVLRLNMENRLRRALEMNEYVLHYQPKIEAASGKLLGAEALIRWHDPLTGLVPPGRFIPLLEQTGLIYEVGRWALNKAMEDYLRWRSAGLPVVPIAVNLSALQLRHPGFVADVRRIVEEDVNAAAGLELEITESLIMKDVDLSIAKLKAIRAMGVTVAIDDFGTGYSSLSYLSKLPVDTVKVDRSFIQEMGKGKEGLRLVAIIINLAHSLQLTVVAEGVETHRQAGLLRRLGCDTMQGFLFSKPLPAAGFEEKYLAVPYRFSTRDRFVRTLSQPNP
jgi:diguanylate cyclase (GGDEF)-like protein/PAS domain S-box-containing protein